MTNFDQKNASRAHCSKCGAAQNSRTLYCAKCGTASLAGQPEWLQIAIRSLIFFGMIGVCVAIGTLSGVFLLMIYLKTSAYSDATLLVWSALSASATAACVVTLLRLRKL